MEYRREIGDTVIYKNHKGFVTDVVFGLGDTQPYSTWIRISLFKKKYKKYSECQFLYSKITKVVLVEKNCINFTYILDEKEYIEL